MRASPGPSTAMRSTSRRLPVKRPRATKLVSSSCAKPMLFKDRSSSIGTAMAGTVQVPARSARARPLGDRTKLSMSRRRPSSLRETRGSSSWTAPAPVMRRLAPPSPASTDTGSSSTAPPAVLKAACTAIGIGSPAAETCAGGPKNTLALPDRLGRQALASFSKASRASMSKRGKRSPPPLSFTCTVWSWPSSPGGEAERHAGGGALDPPGADQRSGPRSARFSA